MLCGRTFQLAGRIVYFVLVARLLGPTSYGTYVACAALMTAISPFAVLGTADVMTKYAARDPKAMPVYFGTALSVTVLFGGLLSVTALLIRPEILPASASTSMLIAAAIAEILGTQIIGICAQVFLALEQASRYAQLLAWTTVLRVGAAIALLFSDHTALTWAWLYAAAGVTAGMLGIIGVSRLCSRPQFRWSTLTGSVREGVHFATATASQFVYDDIDKVMLARLGSVEAAAIYAVAYRFVDASIVPIYSLAAATYPEFFRRGIQGVTATFAFARGILKRSVFYGTIVSLCLFCGAGLVPVIMGHSYAESAVALRYLAALPFLKSVHSFLTDTLTGANYQSQRSAVQGMVAVFNIMINVWLIRAFSFRGAAWSSLMTDGCLLGLLYLVIHWHIRRETASLAVCGDSLLASRGSER